MHAPPNRTNRISRLDRRRRLFREILFENLERRELMATDLGPRLLSISTNAGSTLDANQTGITANVLSESPREIVFRFDGSQSIALSSLNGIQISREGNVDQNFSTGAPIPIIPSYLNFGETDRIVIARFSEPLPDDFYRIDVLGTGSATPIRNVAGETLRPRSGDRESYFMNLELGAKIVAVVPQPTRIPDPINPGQTILNTARNQIEVYFNNDDLGTSVINKSFYQLIRNGDSVNPSDDVVRNPTSITYDPLLDKATLLFSGADDILTTGFGTFRLRIGSNQSAIRTNPIVTPQGSDVGDTFDSPSTSLGTLSGDASHVISEQIVANSTNQLSLNYPGSNADPGTRDIQDEQPLLGTADSSRYTTNRYYSFLLNQPYAQDSQGRPVTTAISELQRQRIREVFEFYSAQLGIQFTETTGLVGPDGAPTLQIVVGDLLSGIFNTAGGPGDFVSRTVRDLNGTQSLAILDGAELWDNDFGYGTQRDNLVNDAIDPTLLANPVYAESQRSSIRTQILQTPLDIVGPNFFIESMRIIGSLIGLGQSNDLPPGTIQGFEPLLGRVENPLEQIFPGDHDVVFGQHLHRPDNRDVDIYRFTVPDGERGTILAQAMAESLTNSSNLDTQLKLFRRDANGTVTLLASNDNYLSSDALIRFEIEGRTGTEFFLAVTAKGNENYDPSVKGSGSGGLSDGPYQLRADYRQIATAASSIRDTSGTALDGDGDGKAGGEFNYWFRSAEPINVAPVGAPRTIYVDKNASSSNLGSLSQPFVRIQDAVAVAQPGDIIRVLGSHPSNSLTSRRAYEIGDGGPSKPILDDGRELNVPRGVSLMIDAGAIFKLAAAEILVGSDSSTSDRSGASIQVLGVPGNSVYFTSYFDETLGRDSNPLTTTPQRGNWGGIEIRNDVAREQGRIDLELAGIFLNYVAMADMRFGGGSVGQGSLSRVVNPIHMNSSRPTILYNRITQSADAGVSADPTSFEETFFTEGRYQFTGLFSPDYTRIGPAIRGNRISDSSTNGLFIRVDTLPGQRLETLDVAARLDDTDIVHVLGETLTINGTPGGAVSDNVRPDVAIVNFTSLTVGSLTLNQTYTYQLTFVDRYGQESLPSLPISQLATSTAHRLNSLPAATDDFVGRRLYRSNNTVAGAWDLIAELDRGSSFYEDTGIVISAAIIANPANALQLFVGTSPNLSSSTVTNVVGGTLPTRANFQYRISIVESSGVEGLASNFLSIPFNPNDPIASGPHAIQLAGLPTAAAGQSRKIYRTDPFSPGRWDLVTILTNPNTTSFLDVGNSIANGIFLTRQTFVQRARPDASLVIDPGIVLKAQGSRIEVGMNAQLVAEGTASKPIVFTSRLDDRYGAGGTFDTNNDQSASVAQPGDWSGILGLHLSTVSIDSAVVTFGGGASRVPGGFASFNAIELHQSDARVVNSFIESNASGAGTPTATRRSARGVNDAAAVYVSGSQPTIVNNVIRNNSILVANLLASTFQNGETAAISIDANSLKSIPKLDPGRSTGFVDIIDTGSGNRGPLVSGNRLGNNAINGMRVRGATITTESVWDDTDIVHVVQKEIVIPDFHTYGGLRLQSEGNASLVVKLSGATAGFTALGRPLDITDRIGGSLQILGSPGFPVILTALTDDSVGAGFAPDGGPSVDTNNDGINQGTIVVTLPTGPEVDRGILIDNDVVQATPGFFTFQPQAGGGNEFGAPVGAGVGISGISAQGRTQSFINQDVIFEFLNMVDVGSDGGALSLANTTITLNPTLISPDLVASEGNFVGNGGAVVNWRVESRFDNGIAQLVNTITFTSTSPLGNIRYINYLDEDVGLPSDGILFTRGTPGQADFRAFTVDGAERVGFSQGGVYTSGPGLQNATYSGWSADEFSSLRSAILGTGTQYTQPGNIVKANLPAFNDPTLGSAFGPRDVTTAFAWNVDPTATTATITTFLELLPRVVRNASTAGEWRGIVLDAYGNDRNVDTTYEYEPDQLSGSGPNSIPTSAQDIGNLARDIESGDENVRLGLTVSGAIANPSDIDVYRFTATTGSMVWFDIDRTSGNLDTVVELVSENGMIIALSDNSFDESVAGSVTYFDRNAITDSRIYTLDQGIFSQRNTNAPTTQVDFQGVNPLDAGFRVALPGTPGTTNTYFVRVRSSNVRAFDTIPRDRLLNTALVGSGVTSGSYRLQLRLQQTDEVGGSTIRYSDIRYADRAIAIQGGPLHSPLLGELSQPDPLEIETDSVFVGGSGNLTLGNIFNYDRGAVSIAGSLAGQADVDWYRFSIDRELNSGLESQKHQSVIFDVDYADGLGRPDTSLWVFSATAGGAPQRLILMGRDSDITDDKAAPRRGSNASDITRGSFGSGDAFIGAYELPDGDYVVAVTSNSQMARVLDQFSDANSTNPLVRLEPLDSVIRIADDRISPSLATTFYPPKQSAFPIAPVGSATNVYPNAVPYSLADVTAFVVRDNPAAGAARSQILFANAMTAAKEAEGGTRAGGGITTSGFRVRDIAASPAGLLVGPALPPATGRIDDSNASRFTQIGADGVPIAAPTNSSIGTVEIIQTGPTAFTSRLVRQGTVDVGIGMTFTAVTFADDTDVLTMFGVAQRGAGGFEGQTFDEAIITPGTGGAATTTAISPSTGVARNILYRLDPVSQNAISPPAAILGDRTGDARSTGTGTDNREYGIFADIDANISHYVRRANGFADTIIVRREAAGDIVGIAEIGNFIYGVTDQGELWRMTSTNYNNGFRGAELVASNLPVGLTGLSRGPRNLTIDAPTTEFILDMPFRVNGGMFRLRFGGNTTADLPFNANAATIQAALQALPSIGAGNIRVGGPSPGATLPESPMAITLIGDLAGDPRAITLSPNAPLAIIPFVSFDKPDPATQFYRLKIPTNTTGGMYSLKYGTDPVLNFPYDASALQIQTAILGLPSIVAANTPTPGVITVLVRTTAAGVYDITFGGTGAPENLTLVPLSSSLSSNLPVPATTVTKQTLTSYGSMLFGIAPNGTLHAFDLNGLPQNIFPGGISSSITNLTANGFDDSLSVDGSTGTDVQGIDFSVLDVNLWHVTTERNADDGHGIKQNFNLSHANAATGGNASLYFGVRENGSNTGKQPGVWTGIYDVAGGTANPVEQTYNLAGGAHGALESNPIDLTGYAPDDQIMLYFSYYLETENSNSSLADALNMQDAFRVYGYGPNGNWILLGTNNSANSNDTNVVGQFTTLTDEYDTPVSGYQDALGRSYRTQELFDQAAAGGSWRQARINLAPLAGMQDARLRFEFSTSGDFRTGDPLRGGIELTGVSGDRIKAGDSFSLVLPVINPVAPPPTPITFLFDVDGSLPAAPNVILVDPSMTAAEVRDEVRLALARVINGNADGDEDVRSFPIYGDTVRVFHYLVNRSGPLHATTNRGADKLGAYTGVGLGVGAILGDLTGVKDYQRAFRTSQNNATFEGVYIDDIVIGFAERGEQIVHEQGNGQVDFIDTPFYEEIGGPNGAATTQTEAGAYQLEIRTAAEYGDQGDDRLGLQRSFDTNERLSEQVAMIVSRNIAVVDGDKFTIDDGYSRVTFEFDIRATITAPSSVTPGNIAVPLVLPQLSANANAGTVATAIRNAINGPTGQSVLRVTAGLRGQITGNTNSDLHRDASNVVELFARDGSLPISSITTVSKIPGAANALSDAVVPHPLDPNGLSPTRFPPIQIAGIFIYGKEAKFGVLPFGEDLGDSSRYRDQGQIVISSNSISDSANFGIVVDAGLLNRPDLAPSAGPRPTPGPVRNLVTLNTDNLAPGAVLVNNVLIRGGSGGIQISGAGASTAGGLPPFTVARVINNTIYGGVVATGTGIQVNQGASPTLINNILANNNVGIAAGASTVAGGNLFSENNTNISPATLVGTFDIFLNPGEQLFNDLTNDKFYLSSQARAIDSSLGSLIERPSLTSVKSGIGRLPNPMIAPDRDVGGLLRQDDPLVLTPAGQGQNVFIDRGAVDRSDFIGPFASIRRPLDNDSASGDTDPNTTVIKLSPTTPPLDFFEILLDENQGTGADPESVTKGSVILTENGRILVEGIDYVFGYSVNSRTIRFTPLSGFWRQDSVYELTLNNRSRLRVDAARGGTLLDGTMLVAALTGGGSVTLEYEAGYVVQVPQTSTLRIPAAGSSAGGLSDGQTFTIGFNATSLTFELDTDGVAAPNSRRIAIPNNASSTAVRDAILIALQGPTGAGLQLNLKAVGVDEIHLGTGANHSVTVNGSNLVLVGSLSGIEDGQTFIYQSGTNAPVTFEFNIAGNAFTSGNREIAFIATDTFEDIAAKVTTSLTGVVVGATPVRNVGNGVVHLGGQIGDTLNVSLSSLKLLGTPGVSGSLKLRVPGSGMTFSDGQTFSIQSTSGTTTFEFTKDATVSLGNRAIAIADSDPANVIAARVSAAIAAANLGFTPTVSGGSTITLNEPLGTGFALETAPFVVTGVAGGAVPVRFFPAPDFSEELVASQIAKVLNDLPDPRFASVKAQSAGGNTLFVEGLLSITNVTSTNLPAIVDLAGNPLQANRPNGFTQFTIVMPDAQFDFGDALSNTAPTLLKNNGARHVGYPIDVLPLRLGALVDFEPNALPNATATGDDINGVDDEDGVRFPSTSFFNANSPPVTVTVSVTGIGYLDAWIDWNGDGDFDDLQEKIVDSQPVSTGDYPILVTTPSSASPGDRWARFRLSSTGGLFPSGAAIGGEVEDYVIRVIPGAPPLAVNDSRPEYIVNEDSPTPLVIPAAIGILSNDTDTDVGQTLSVLNSAPISGPSSGVLILNADGSFSYAPNQNFSGIDTFTYIVVDSLGLGSIAPATVTITVAPVNDAPEFTLPLNTLDVIEDQGADSAGNPSTISFANFATGIRPGPTGSISEDSQVLTFNVVAIESTLFAVLPTISSTGTLSFALARDRNSSMPGFDGRVVVTLVDDGSNVSPNVNSTASVTFTINVAPVNDSPIADAFSPTNVEDSSRNFTAAEVLSGDASGPATATDEIQSQTNLTITGIAAQSVNGGTVTPVLSGSIVSSFNYTPPANFAGIDTFTYTLSDNAIPTPATNTGTITINVTAVNDVPAFTVPSIVNVDEDQGSTINGSVQTQVAISISSFATNVGPGPAGASDEGLQVLRFDVATSDSSFYEVLPTITRNTTNPSEATLTFTLAKHRNNLSPNGANNTIQVTLVDDGGGVLANVQSSASQTVSININPINDAPVADVFNPTVVEDASRNFTAAEVLAGDTAGPSGAEDEQSVQILSITRIDQRSDKGGVITQTGVGSITGFRYIPAPSFVGQDTFTYTLSDNASPTPGTTTGTITVTVTAVNDAPEFTPGSAVVIDEDAGAYSQAWATKVLPGPSTAVDETLSQTLSFEVSATNASLFKTLPSIDATGVLKFESARNANGTSVISVTSVDTGDGVAPNVNRSATVTFTITISPVNDPPSFTSGGNVTVNEDTGAVNQNWATSIFPAAALGFTPPEATDEVSQTVSFFVLSNSNPTLFSVAPDIAADGKISFTTAPNAFGTTIITAVARDNGSLTSPNVNESQPVTFTISIAAVNDAPIGGDDRFQTTEDALLTIASSNGVKLNDRDPDNAVSEFSVIAGNITTAQGAAVVVNADGSFTYDPRSASLLQKLLDGQSVDDTFVYRLQDIQSAISQPVTVTVTVQGINDAPTANNDLVSAAPNSTTPLNVLANDTDPDSLIDATSLRLGILPANGTIVILANGQINYTPSAGFRGTDTFTYRVRDTSGLLSNEGTVTVRINSVPLAVTDRVSVLTNSSVVINVLSNDTDADGNSTLNRSSVTIIALSPNGTAVVQSDGTVLFTPTTGFAGQTSFTYTIRDSENPPATSVPGLVTVDVVLSLFQNPRLQYDVNDDGFVSPIDALIVINDLQRRGTRALLPSEPRPPYLDVNGNSMVDPNDVLQVINFLNRQSRNGSGEGESNRVTSLATPAIDKVHPAMAASAATPMKKRSQQIDAAFADSSDESWGT